MDIARNILSKESDIPCVFLDCSKISKITVAEGNPVYDSRSNCNAVIETATNKLLFGCRNTIIPEDVVIIGNYAFFDSKDLTELHIPASVTKIGENVFGGCPNHFVGNPEINLYKPDEDRIDGPETMEDDLPF